MTGQRKKVAPLDPDSPAGKAAAEAISEVLADIAPAVERRRAANAPRESRAMSRRELVKQWLTENGLDPGDIPINATWTIDEHAQTITIDRFVRGEDGRIVTTKAGPMRETVTVPLRTRLP